METYADGKKTLSNIILYQAASAEPSKPAENTNTVSKFLLGLPRGLCQ